MERRKALQIAAGVLAVGSAGTVTLAKAFKPEIQSKEPKKIKFEENDSQWIYSFLDPAETGQRAYEEYAGNGCMYGIFNGILSQLAEKIGDPYTSFPVHMMKYGHGGVNGTGTVCGALNGPAALIGLLVGGKVQDSLVGELFRWYENSALPNYKPENPGMDFTPPTSVSNSVLCHASTTKWGKEAGFKIASKERKERCRRLTADVAAQTVVILNSYFDDAFIATAHNNETVQSCMTCHGSEGKLGNTSGKMNCTPCHEESLAHKVFSDVHYKMMD
jgi:hypothetical protein